MHKIGTLQAKILLLLLGGVTLALTNSPERYFRVIREMKREWDKIDRKNLTRSIRALYESRLISKKANPDGSVTVTLTQEGKARALTYNLENMQISKPRRWDGIWRAILFDIPECNKNIRNAFRAHLKRLGFYEFQKSVFVHPYDCKDEIDYLIEFYDARRYIRFMLVKYIDNELHLKKYFFSDTA